MTVPAASVVFVLGMHRSGTSCLAGSLEACGLHLGDVRRTGRHNARGYFERRDVVRHHDQILALNRGSWFQPPRHVTVHPHHRQVLSGIADELDRHRPSGLKDPRLLLVLDEWLTLVQPPHACVGTFRHPGAVVASLARRDGMRPEVAARLWCDYNARLVERHRQVPFPLIEYDLTDVDGYCRTVAGLACSLDLTADLPAVRRFVESSLEHHPTPGLSIPPECDELYRYLRHHRIRVPQAAPSSATPPQPSPASAPPLARSAVNRGTDWMRAWRASAVIAGSSDVRSLFFVGNSRSGTTLVRSLLDAHPMMIVGLEVDALARMRNGAHWRETVRRIVYSSLQFRRRPVWTDYDYRVPGATALDPKTIRVIGDKKAEATARALAADPEALHRFLSWVRVPVTFIHCVRHPLDVIATITLRTGRRLGPTIDAYFAHEAAAVRTEKALGPDRFIRIFQERFITTPAEHLCDVMQRLRLPEPDPLYLRACASVVDRSPRHTRHDVYWTPQVLDHVWRRVAEFPHLSCYQDDRA